MASDIIGLINKIQEYENIVYPGSTEGTRFPEFGKNFNQETIRFRDNVNPDSESMCLRGSIAQVDQFEITPLPGFIDPSDPIQFNPLRDLTVFFEVNPYSARVCLTIDVDTCSSPFIPIERCEQMSIAGETLEGTDGPDRLSQAIGSPSTLINGFAGDDVLFARNDGDVIDAKEGNDLIFVNNVG